MEAPPVGRRGLLILDFDGTLWRGDGPLLAYAEAVADELPDDLRAGYLQRVVAFLAGDRWGAAAGGLPPADGWAAVAEFAAPLGLSAERRQAAFLATRARIAEGEFLLEVPDGLPAFLESSRAECGLVLASNSPASSVEPVLDHLGLSSLFDAVVCGAGKPAGLAELGAAWQARTGLPSERIMSVGDHYPNDIAPAVAAGWASTYISPWRVVPGPCSVVGTSMEEVLPPLRGWVRTIVAAEGRTWERSSSG